MKSRKTIICMLVLLLLAPISYAQRYLPGMKGIQLTGGIVDGTRGFHTGFAYSRYDRHQNRWVTGLHFLNRNTDDPTGKIPVSQFTAEGGYYLKMLSDRRKIVFLSVGLSALAGYETVNWGKKALSDGGRVEDRDRFVGGGAVGMEAETYLTDRIVLLLNVRERALWGADTDKFHTEIGFGIKYIIN